MIIVNSRHTNETAQPKYDTAESAFLSALFNSYETQDQHSQAHTWTTCNIAMLYSYVVTVNLIS